MGKKVSINWRLRMETGSVLKFVLEKSRLTGRVTVRRIKPDCRLRAHDKQYEIVEKDHLFDDVLVISLDGSA